MIEEYQLFISGFAEPIPLDSNRALDIQHAIIERTGYRWIGNDGSVTYIDFGKVAWARIVPPEYLRQQKLRGER
jgi:hypothetical protein